MRNVQTGVLLLLGAVLATAGYLTLRSVGLLVRPAIADVRPVPAGCHEVAFVSPATSADTWARLVEAAGDLGEQGWSGPGGATLAVDASAAFPRLSTDVPELALWVRGCERQKLLVRWYKISSERDPAGWVDKLAARLHPPVAVLGGESTNRAVEIGQALEARRGDWRGVAPLFLLTTATADTYTCKDMPRGADRAARAALPDWYRGADNQRPLMDLYQGRNFRFSFTNTVMTRGVMGFVAEHPELWPDGWPLASPAVVAVTAAEPLTRLAALHAAAPPHYALYAVAWADNEYSKDLRDRFSREFFERHHTPGEFPDGDVMLHSVGDAGAVNAQDIQAVWRFLTLDPFRATGPRRQMLVLPVGAQQAKRYLRALAATAPDEARRVVALSGDSISFNHVYRDRQLAWHVLEVPVPLVFFSHRNPIDRAAGFHPQGTDDRPWATTGTQDLLFYRDVLEAVLLAAYRDGVLAADADAMKERLAGLHWAGGRLNAAGTGVPLFDAQRNRREGTGEHVVWVQPHRDEAGRVLPRSTISVWHRDRARNGGPQWELASEPLRDVLYGQARPALGDELEGVEP